MAFVKVLAVAVCLSAASAAPQYAQQLVRAIPAATTVHAIPQTATVVRSQPATVLTHASPSVVRLAQPATVQTFAHPVQQTIVRAAPVAIATHVVEEEEEVVQADASYNFGYSVADASSGDSKTREETREGDVVRGSYSVADPDGRVRVVEYTADAENGFQAKVTYDGEEGPVAIPFNAPEQAHVVAAAPAQTVIAARTEPVASHLVHAAPATTVVRTAAAPQTLVHSVAQPTVVRAAAPATTVVRTAAAPQARHVLHNVAQPTVLRAATTTQALHQVAQPTFVRAIPATQQFVSVPASANVVRAFPAGTTLTHF